MSNKYKVSVLAVTLATLMAGCTDDSSSSVQDDFFVNLPAEAEGRWAFGDTHIHSTGSDGSYTIDRPMHRGFFEFDADFLFSTDHGGFDNWGMDIELYRLEEDGTKIFNPIPSQERHSYHYAIDRFDRQKQNKDHIFEYVFNKIEDIREELPEKKYAIMGFEWGKDQREHSTLVTRTDDVEEIKFFHNKYQNGSDYCRSFGSGEDRFQCTLEGAEYLQGIADDVFWAMNHPSRQYKMQIHDIRTLHNLAPDALSGMEGAPGHQKEPASRGGYKQEFPHYIDEYRDEYGIAYHGQTYGGFDYMTSQLGGTWDALLSEGRRFFIYAGSDFHERLNEFWPGQYTKTHVFMEEESQDGLFAGLKSGNSYITHGDLIKDLYFVAMQQDDQDNHAWMGQTLEVPAGGTVEIAITMENRVLNHNDENPEVAFVDLIAGKVSDKIPESHPDYNKPFADNTVVIQSFERGSEHWREDGNTVKLRFTLENVEEDMYFRLRGSNNPKGTKHHVDSQGNAQLDFLKNYDDVAKQAWNDLWFYSNPIFVEIDYTR